MYLLARVGTRAGTPLYSASLGQPGQCIYLPVLVLVLVPLVQCFAWSARAMNLFARFHICAVYESLHSVYCACIPCTVLRLVRTGNVPTCPCSYSYWYFLSSALLGQHGQCTYFSVVVLVLMSARVMYLLARVCTRTGASCAVLCSDSTGNVHTCPSLYPCTVFVQCFAWTARAIYLLARGYSYRYLLCNASLGQHGQCPYLPVVVLVLVPLVQCFAWTARAMYLSSCLDSRAVLVALLLLAWTVCWWYRAIVFTYVVFVLAICT